MKSDKIKLSETQIRFLLNHIGYGAGIDNPEKVKILFIGNESGTAGRSTYDYIEHLTHPEKYHVEVKLQKDTSCFSLQKQPTMLQFLNRLKLYSQEKDTKWLLNKKELTAINHEDYHRVQNECWSKGESIHLFDIRPLPRKTENEKGIYWPYDNDQINEKNYMKAFNKFEMNDSNQFSSWVYERNSRLKLKIKEFSNLECIIAPGHAHMKIKFLKGLFPEIDFITKKESSNKVFHIANYKIENICFKIIVCEFLSGQYLGFEGLKDLAKIAFDK